MRILDKLNIFKRLRKIKNKETEETINVIVDKPLIEEKVVTLSQKLIEDPQLHRMADLSGEARRRAFVHPISSGMPEQTASYIIFTDGTTIWAKNGNTGQIQFSGTDASTVIQAALNGLTSGRTWKEKVLLKGSFTLSAKIALVSHLELILDGLLTLQNGVNTDTIYGANLTNFIIKGGIVDSGTQSGTVFGLQLTNSSNGLIENIEFKNGQLGLIIRGNCNDITVRKSKAVNCALQGFNIGGYNNKLLDSIVDGGCSEFGVVVGNGVNLKVENNRLKNLSGTAALEIGYYSDGVIISNNVIADNITTAGIYFLPRPGDIGLTSLSNCIVKDNYVVVSGANIDALYATREASTEYPIYNLEILNNYLESANRDALRLARNGGSSETFNRVLVEGNILKGSTWAIYSEARDITISKNIIISGDIATTSQPRVYIYRNIGYVTESNGTATVLSGTSSIVVNLSGQIVNVNGSPTTVITSVNTSGYGDRPYYPSNFNSGSFTIYGVANTSASVTLSYTATYGKLN